MATEHFDVLTEEGHKTGTTTPRGEVHAQGLYHRAVHTWIFCATTGELLLQQRASCKDSWPDRWDISSAGHLSAGEESLPTAMRECWEELGLVFSKERIVFLYTHLELLSSIQKGKPFVNNEFNDVYLVCVDPGERASLDPETAVVGPLPPDESLANHLVDSGVRAPLAFRLQDVEVQAVRWLPWRVVRDMYLRDDPTIVPTTDAVSYRRLWAALEERDKSESP